MKNNTEAWKKVSLKDYISLKKSFVIAEKVDRLIPTFNQEINENFRTNFNNSYKSSNFNKNQSKGKIFNDSKIKQKDSTVDNLTKRIKDLTVRSNRFYLINAMIDMDRISIENLSRFFYLIFS